MRKLKMLTTGPNGNYRRGQIVEVDDQRAERLLAGRHATTALNRKLAEEVIDGDTERTSEL